MIENPRSARVRSVARLARRADRVERASFLLEGPQALREALRYRPELITEAYATPTAMERHADIADAAAAADVEIEYVAEEALDAMADTVTPQGFVAVCRQFPASLKSLFSGGVRLVAILEQVRDPGNLGTIIRAADAAGADAVVLTGRTVDLYNPKVVRSTTGSLFHLPVAVGADLGQAVARAREAGLAVLAADVKGDDLTGALADGSLSSPTAWVFGNEARGLDDADLALADRVVRVPIFGRAESMNLSTAASVCLYQSAFAQRA